MIIIKKTGEFSVTAGAWRWLGAHLTPSSRLGYGGL